MLYSAYLCPGQGVSDDNTDIMRNICQHRLTHDWSCVIAGDFQTKPSDWVQSPLPSSANLKIIAGSPRGRLM